MIAIVLTTASSADLGVALESLVTIVDTAFGVRTAGICEISRLTYYL